MSTATFRIPRVTAAVLLLGGVACSEDTTNTHKHDAGARDDNDGGNNGADGGTHGGKPIDSGGLLGGGGVLGGGGGGAPSANVDVSAARFDRTAKAFCMQYAECYPEDFAMYYGSQAECVSDSKSYFSQYVRIYGKDCADAILDAIDCTETVPCDQDPAGPCAAEGEALMTLCPDTGAYSSEEVSSSTSTKKHASARKKRAGLRIPR